MDPIRSYGAYVRPDRQPVPARNGSNAVVPIGGKDADLPMLARDASGSGSEAPRMIPPITTTPDIGQPSEVRRSHAQADLSYRRTMALQWGVRRTVDFEV